MTLPKGFEPPPPPPPLPDKTLRCKMGFHEFENKVRGKYNICKLCRRECYVRTWKEKLNHNPYGLGDGEGG